MPAGSLLGLLYAFLLLNSISPVLSLGLYYAVSGFLGPFHRFWAPLSHFILLGILDSFHHFRAPLSHLGSFVPFVFPSHYHGLLLTSLGFPGPITLFSSLGLMSLPSTPYFLCFHYFGPAAAHSYFFTSYTAHGLLFLSFRAP